MQRVAGEPLQPRPLQATLITLLAGIVIKGYIVAWLGHANEIAIYNILAFNCPLVLTVDCPYSSCTACVASSTLFDH